MEEIAAESVMVIVLCRDGKLRQAPLTTKQAAKVRRTVSHLHGGDIRLNPEEILVMSEADAMEAFGKLTGKLPFLERWRRRIARMKDIWFSYPNPLTKAALVDGPVENEHEHEQEHEKT